MPRNPFAPDVRRYVVSDVGERVVDEVPKHWIAYVWPGLRFVFAWILFCFTFSLPEGAWWVGLIVSGAIGFQALYRAFSVYLDRFVITNIRVFRVHGVLTREAATMPMSRILDVAIKVPLLGRILGYGHFQFESAAQDQGLRDIRFVPHPYQRDLTIQRAIQRSGARGGVVPSDGT